MRTILAIVNTPEKSDNFMAYIAHMAMDLSAKVHFLHVSNPDIYPMGVTGSTGIEASEVHAALDEYNLSVLKHMKEKTEQIKNMFSGKVNFGYSAETGTPKYVIENYVKKMNAMLVLQNHENVSFWGHDASYMEIIDHVHCPIWVVAPDAEYSSFKDIVYATDYHQEDIMAIKSLISMPNKVKPNILALHVTDMVDFDAETRNEGFKTMLQENTGYKNIEVKTVAEKDKNDVAQVISKHAQQSNADLIVVLKENRNFLERIFKSSSTEKIIKKSQSPVLVLQEEQSEF